jgi:hypothetical protein
MRAEPHYVETLARPGAEKARPPATAPADPPVTPASDRPLGAATAALAGALGAINQTLRDLPVQGRPLRERLLLELARADAVRAGWLADALAVLQHEPMPALDQVNLTGILDQVAAALGPEQRVTGDSPRFTFAERPVMVFGDERLITVAVGGMLQALGLCVGRLAPLGRIEVRMSPPREAATRGIELVQTALRVPETALSRFFDADWAEHPAGAAGAALLAAARRIAALQGGRLEVRPLDAGGCRLTLALPAAE